MKIRIELSKSEVSTLAIIASNVKAYSNSVARIFGKRESGHHIRINPNTISWNAKDEDFGKSVEITMNSGFVCKVANVWAKGFEATISLVAAVAPTVALFMFRMKQVNAEYNEVLEELVQVPTEINSGESMTSEQGDSTTAN
jgi:hypothetical protein